MMRPIIALFSINNFDPFRLRDSFEKVMRTTETTRRFRVSSQVFRDARVRKSQSNKFMKERRTVWPPAFSQAFERISKRFLRFPCDLPTANSETVTPVRPCVSVKIKRDASATGCVVRYTRPTTDRISNQSGFM